MASKKIELYSKKQFELNEIKNRINEEFEKHLFSNVEFQDAIFHELGETKTLLLVYENWFWRNKDCAGLVIMLSEHGGHQYADIIATGGKTLITSWGAEGSFARRGKMILEKLGFQENA